MKGNCFTFNKKLLGKINNACGINHNREVIVLYGFYFSDLLFVLNNFAKSKYEADMLKGFFVSTGIALVSTFSAHGAAAENTVFTHMKGGAEEVYIGAKFHDLTAGENFLNIDPSAQSVLEITRGKTKGEIELIKKFEELQKGPHCHAEVTNTDPNIMPFTGIIAAGPDAKSIVEITSDQVATPTKGTKTPVVCVP